ncbi:MAG: type III pantothenate kinase [Coriobacteriia bacterium]|nr:type III pantothenate kinase [Coriobacteriia bacterium]
MILAVDIGNTQTVLGLISEDCLDGRWRVSTDATLTADEIRVKIGALLALEGHDWEDVAGVVIASVVPVLTLAYEELAERATGRLPLVVGPGIKTGLPVSYENPHEVGADRIVNAVAAIAEHSAPVIVVDFGTATTLDVVDANGSYLGGAIAAGIETSAEALFLRAARLSAVELEPPSHAIGRNTRESIQSGLLLGEAAKVDGLVRMAWAEMGSECKVVATGGLAEMMAPLCETIGFVDSDLTLKGLALIWKLNSQR